MLQTNVINILHLNNPVSQPSLQIFYKYSNISKLSHKNVIYISIWEEHMLLTVFSQVNDWLVHGTISSSISFVPKIICSSSGTREGREPRVTDWQLCPVLVLVLVSNNHQIILSFLSLRRNISHPVPSTSRLSCMSRPPRPLWILHLPDEEELCY